MVKRLTFPLKPVGAPDFKGRDATVVLMTPAKAPRPVLIAPALVLALAGAAALSGCEAAANDPHRFRALADQVAAVDVPLTPAVQHSKAGGAGEPSGLRPIRFSAVKVAVMDPHAMWDARDDLAGVRRVAHDAGLRDGVIPAADPVGPAPLQTPDPAAPQLEAGEAPILSRAGPRRPEASARTIQLGAYSSPDAARQAWARMKTNRELATLSPVFEPVVAQGRTLTRLKVGPVSNEGAVAVCRALDVADAWCARNS